MNRNHFKVIACLAMLCDHVGYFLLPQIAFLRYIGRLAMPLFAFFIGEGCRYTRNRKRYFLQIFLLGAACQAVFIAAELIENRALTAGSDAWYFNILFTFGLSCPACFWLLDARALLREQKRAAAAKKFGLLAGYLAALSLFVWFAWRQRREAGWGLAVDYGLCGILLPLSTALFDDDGQKLFAFTLALLVYGFTFSAAVPYVWFSLLSAPLLACYNGKSGSRKLKYLFYVFYPAHLGILYLISLFL